MNDSGRPIVLFLIEGKTLEAHESRHHRFGIHRKTEALACLEKGREGSPGGGTERSQRRAS